MEKRRYKIKPPEVWTQVRKDYLSGLDAKTVAARHDVTNAAGAIAVRPAMTSRLRRSI